MPLTALTASVAGTARQQCYSLAFDKGQPSGNLPGWLLQVTGVRHAMTEPGLEGGARLGPSRGGSTMKLQWQMRGCAGWGGPLAKLAWTWAMNLSALASEAQVLHHAAVCSRLVMSLVTALLLLSLTGCVL